MPTDKDIYGIKALLVRYYDGQSSEEDEKVLRHFFTETPCECLPEEMLPDRELFMSLASVNDMMAETDSSKLPEGVAAQFDRFVDQLAAEAHTTCAGAPKRKTPVIRELTAWISAAAACIMAAWLVTGILRFDRSDDGMPSDFASARPAPSEVSAADSMSEITVRTSDIGMHTAAAVPEPSVSASRPARHPRTPELTPEEIDAEVTRALSMMQRALDKGIAKVEEAQSDLSDTNRKTVQRVEEALQMDLPGINRPLSI